MGPASRATSAGWRTLLGRALLLALEDAARELGHRAVRLDSQSATWPLYLGAGYQEIADYNDNPHADFWGEKPL